MMGNMEQEQYYIATEDGKTEGPYSFASLETFCTEGKITPDTLVCIAGDQGWMRFYALLEHERKIQAFQRGEATRKKEEEARRRFEGIRHEGTVNEWPVKEIREIPFDSSKVLSGIFRFVGIACFVLSAVCIILLASTHKGEPIVNNWLAIAASVTLIFSGLGFFWCAKIIELLSRAVDLLSVIAKRVYNSGNSTDKK